ncbi:MAG TPA: hypothetical protein VM187_08630, partial [Niastella sp.]|nr:hypothetical protein [Niastella sp.]
MAVLKNICFISILAVNILLSGCVRESDIPPGCNTPPTPTIKPITKTILYEGQYLELEGVPAEGLDEGTYEWEGPNGYFAEGKNVTVPYVTGKHNGDFKFYYLDKNKCRSQAAVMRVIVYTYVNSCSIPENRIRD